MMQAQAVCPKCHAVLAGDPQDPERCEECYQATATFCDSCGREIPDGDVFCDECQEVRDEIAAEEAEEFLG